MQKVKNRGCMAVSCVDRNQNLVKCCFDYEKSKAESEINATIRMATGLDDLMSGSFILK